MYITSILFYLSWPALIIVSYYAVLFALKQFEKKAGKVE
jgi:hypothetical protein